MNLIAWTIVACEIGFWFIILAGLITRYVFNRKRLGLFFLALPPVTDLLLLIVTVADLFNGAVATQFHAVAAVYLGVSITYRRSKIRWADERFFHYIKKQGTKPEKKTDYTHARHAMKDSLQHLLAYMIGGFFLLAMIYFVGDASRTGAMLQMWKLWTIIVVIDLATSLSYFIWPQKMKVK